MGLGHTQGADWEDAKLGARNVTKHSAHPDACATLMRVSRTHSDSLWVARGAAAHEYCAAATRMHAHLLNTQMVAPPT